MPWWVQVVRYHHRHRRRACATRVCSVQYVQWARPSHARSEPCVQWRVETSISGGVFRQWKQQPESIESKPFSKKSNERFWERHFKYIVRRCTQKFLSLLFSLNFIWTNQCIGKLRKLVSKVRVYDANAMMKLFGKNGRWTEFRKKGSGKSFHNTGVK